MASKKPQKSEQIKAALQGKKGDPIYDDLGRIVGFVGEAPLDRPIDHTDMILSKRMASMSSLKPPMRINNDQMDEAANRQMVVQPRRTWDDLTPEEQQQQTQQQTNDSRRQQLLQRMYGAGPAPDKDASQPTGVEELHVKPFKRSYTKRYIQDDQQPTEQPPVQQQPAQYENAVGGTPHSLPPAPTNTHWQSFIEAAKKVAKETNFPLSVILGQAALETGRTASPGNNYFGIKGEGTAGTQDLATQEATSEGDFYNTRSNFAAYNSPEDSVRAYVDLIKNKFPQAYAQKANPVAMIQAIHQGGYATDPAYSQKVMSTPEFRQYQSANYTVPPPPKPVMPRNQMSLTQPTSSATLNTSVAPAMPKQQAMPKPVAQPKPNMFQQAVGGVKHLFGF